MTSNAPSARFFSTVPDRRVDQLRAVEDGLDLDPRRHRLGDFAQARGNRIGNDPAVAACDHQGGADDDLLAVFRSRAGAQIAADTDGRDIAHRHRHAAARGDGGAPDFIERADAAIGA
jgi:hypothetical protein